MKLSQMELAEQTRERRAQLEDRSIRSRLVRRLWHGRHANPSPLDTLALMQPERLTIGRFTYGAPRVLAFGGNYPALRIGAFCSIAEGVEILLNGDHRSDWISTYPFRLQLGLDGMGEDGHPSSRGGVDIGNDVWLARNAVLLSGVTIGHGAVVGAGAVVSRDVSPYAVVVGNPAKQVKLRFPAEVIEALLRIRWWDWGEERVREAVPFLSSSNVADFVERYG